MLRVSEYFSDSDLGRQRKGNEDSFFVRSPLFVVADGMGGAQAGEVASQMAVEAFDGGLPEGDPADGLSRIVESANRRIHRTSVQEEGRHGMGTTVTAAYVGERGVTIAHVGDSRAYLLRGGVLTRLTRDHSLVGELVERGKLTEEQAEQHPQRSVITRALGPEPEVAVDTETFPAKAGDVFLLCSDGLTSMVPEAGIAPLLTGAGSLADAGRRLINAANDAGGRDNITVLLLRLEEVEPGRGAAASEQPTMAGEGALRTTDVQRAVDDAGGPSAVAVADPPRAGTRTLPDPQEDRPGAASPAPSASPPRRRRRRRIPPAAIMVMVIAIPVISGMLLALRAVYFIGTDPNDGRTVTVFRGLPYELPGGLKLYTRYGGSGVTLEAVPVARRTVFSDHKLRTRDDALGLVNDLERGRVAP